MEKSEIMALLKRTEAGNNYTGSLLKEYGYNRVHPRTGETIVSQTSSIINSAQTPRVAYHRRVNQNIKTGGFTINPDTKEISGSATYKKTAQWKTIWFNGGRRK